MSHLRHTVLTVALVTTAIGLVACNTAPTMPMSAASANSMAMPNQMARMDAQIKTMRDMHEKMAGAKTQEERSKLMAEHMTTMQDGMATMNLMSASGMVGRGGKQGSKPMPADMNQRQQIMAKAHGHDADDDGSNAGACQQMKEST